MILVLKFEEATNPGYIALSSGSYVVGRGKDCDIRLENPTVSRKHCIIKYREGHWLIEDLGSKNGVHVNDIAVLTTERLKDGDYVLIGKVMGRIELYEEEDYLKNRLSPLPLTVEFLQEEETEVIMAKTPIKETEAKLLEVLKELHLLSFTTFERELLDCLRKQGVEEIGMAKFSSSGLAYLSPSSSSLVEKVLEEKNPRENFSINEAHHFFYNRYIRECDSLYYLVSSSPFEENLFPLLDAMFRYYFLLKNIYPQDVEKELELILEDYIFESDSMKKLIRHAREIAEKNGNVLIEGETGVGKEVLAELIHKWSPRAAGPFVTVNAAAIPDSLAESELFGISKKSVTGVEEKPGKFEAAHNGTLFFDEIGEMSTAIQAKILRAIETGEIYRIGSIKPIRVNIRIIAATNQDLERSVRTGTFRKDLFYRLASFRIKIPPLRERREDIIPLANKFAQELAREYSKPFNGITERAKQLLISYDWPGNVRELKNVIREAIAKIGDDGVLSAKLLTIASRKLPREEESEEVELEAIEKRTIIKALKRTHGNKTKAAKLLGISRGGLIKKIKRLGIKKEDYSE